MHWIMRLICFGKMVMSFWHPSLKIIPRCTGTKYSGGLKNNMNASDIIHNTPQNEKDSMLIHLINLGFMGNSGDIRVGGDMEPLKVLPETFIWQFKQYLREFEHKANSKKL